MHIERSHPLDVGALQKTFVEQTTGLYCAKIHLITHLPDLIDQATFNNLKLAMTEVLDDTKRQMISLGRIFSLLGKSADTESCLAMNAIIHEANNKIAVYPESHYDSDMTIIFYMSVIENLQVGAGRVLSAIVSKTGFEPYVQLVKESLDNSKDNADLFDVIAKEYLESE